MFNLPDPYEFAIRPEEFWILAENGPNVMRVYTDGRKHLDDQWETYTGDSVGHWEGDTLVFTTIGLKGSRDGDAYLSAQPGGKYLLYFECIGEKPNMPANVRITIEQGVARFLPWFLTLVALSLIPLVLLGYHIYFRQKRWENSSIA